MINLYEVFSWYTFDMKSTLVVGDIYIETQFFVEAIPLENEFSFSSEAFTTIGSKTINVARTLVKLNNNVSYCGLIGNDADGKQAVNKLAEYKINIRLISISEESSGKITVITPKSGKSSITLYAGSNDKLTSNIIGSLESIINNFDCVYTSTALPLESLYALVDLCHKHSRPIFLDIPNKQTELDLTKVANVNFFMPNRQECGMLTGQTVNTVDEVKLAAIELRNTIQGTIVVTLDKDGCVVFNTSDQEPIHIPTQSIEAIDETGAGDIFRGAFVSDWLTTQNVMESLKFALSIATSSVLVKGVNTSIEIIR
jgi:ribokinase